LLLAEILQLAGGQELLVRQHDDPQLLPGWLFGHGSGACPVKALHPAGRLPARGDGDLGELKGVANVFRKTATPTVKLGSPKSVVAALGTIETLA
jgi:hypothetical protein